MRLCFRVEIFRALTFLQFWFSNLPVLNSAVPSVLKAKSGAESGERGGPKVDADGRGLGGPALRRARRVAAGALLAAPDVPLAWALAQVSARRLEVRSVELNF